MMKWLAFIEEKRYKMTRIWIGPFFPTIQITHCDLASKVLKLPKSDQIYAYLLPWLGEGLLISQGKKWFRNRRLLTPAFHYEILKGYIPVYNSCLAILLNKWKDSVQRGQPVLVFNDIGQLSLDIVLQCAFSSKSNCQLSGKRPPYIKAVYDLVDLVNERFFTPLYSVDWIFNLTASGKRYKEACRIVHEYAESLINERKRFLDKVKREEEMDSQAMLERVSRKKKYLDFLDILLTAADEDGKGLTDLEIRNEVDTFLFEGHDTTTSGMSFTLYCLAKHPEHQEKVREEVRNVLMGREWLEHEDLKDLKYTQWCIKEAMRLYPPVFSIYRTTTEDIVLEGKTIPKGMLVIVMIRVIHRHPDTWENPNEYDPLRFHPSNVEGRDPYAYMPFSAGHRNCIGQNFALNEEKVVIASIVNRFRLSIDENSPDVEMVPKVVLRTKNDIKLKLEPLAYSYI